MAALAKVSNAVTHAKKASDLDEVLKELQTLQNPQQESIEYEGSSELANKINTTFQFVTQWQDYLSAKNSGNLQEAQNSLRTILNNRQIDAPSFFPRSEILARLVDPNGDTSTVAQSQSGPLVTDPDTILDKVKTADDLVNVLPKLDRVQNPPGGQPWDWSGLRTLAKARADTLAGLTISLDLNSAMNEPVWGENISRIISMDLLDILPRYFDTQVSEPPKTNETVSAYLDRISSTASADGNLALLQRVIAVKVALGTASQNIASNGTRQFLAGLTQDAAGQYAPAVVSYENSLKDPDDFLPTKIVGERLAAIKAAHPDEFGKGLTTFMTPTPIDPFARPGMAPWMQRGPFGGPLGNQISVLPIPMTISISSPATK